MLLRTNCVIRNRRKCILDYVLLTKHSKDCLQAQASVRRYFRQRHTYKTAVTFYFYTQKGVMGSRA